ncbi:MAG TPA: FdtA/QdtA family cupin domain-containing protein [Microbacteriaceae bacterium]|nr:FdtA/QdtA family cupin domain-containing protein [Microbacteriaceae bacterium]
MTSGSEDETVGGVRGVRLVRLDRVDASNGSLTVAEHGRQVPFPVERIFTVFGVPEDEVRGTHAHRACHQFLIAAAGRVTAVVDDGERTAEVVLDRPEVGLYLPPLTWGGQRQYAPGTVLLVLASHPYDRADYIEDHDEFLRVARARD